VAEVREDHREHTRLAQQPRPRHLGVDVKVILTPPCIFCMENH
jgi:hypothetical protein